MSATLQDNQSISDALKFICNWANHSFMIYVCAVVLRDNLSYGHFVTRFGFNLVSIKIFAKNNDFRFAENNILSRGSELK